MQHRIPGYAMLMLGAGCVAAVLATPAQAGGSVTYVRYSSSGCGPARPVSYGYGGGYTYTRGYAAPYVACQPVVAPVPVCRTVATPYVRCATPVVTRTYAYGPTYRSYGTRSGYVGRGSVAHYGGYGYRGYGYRSGSSGRGWSVGFGGSRCGSSAGVSFRYYKR